ncbi:MAG: ExbD/TolR family protein [Planctomycetaceae bacterium]
MARKSGGEPSKTDIDMTPMIDVTFQLITFFVFTLNFSEAVRDDRIQLPMSQLAKPPESPPPDPVALQVMQDGRIIYAGEPVAMQDIGAYLENEKRVLLSAGKEPSGATVVVRGHKNAKTGMVQDLVKACQEKGFERFVLRAEYDESK